MENFGSRLKEARKDAGLSQKELAARSGLSQTTISDIERGRNEGSAEVAALASVLRVRALWLADGKGPMRSTSPSLIYRNSDNGVSEILAMEVKDFGDKYELTPNPNTPPILFKNDWLKEHNYNPDHLVAIQVVGESMSPSLFDGDFVVVNLDDVTPAEGEVFAVSIYNDPIVMKRFQRKSGEWWLYSDWPLQVQYPPKELDDNVRVIGRVVFRQTERV